MGSQSDGYRRAHEFGVALQDTVRLHDVGRVFLSSASSVVRADIGGLYRLDPATLEQVDLVAPVGADFLAAYEEYGRDDDPVLQAAMMSGRPADSSRAGSARHWESSGARAAISLGGYRHSLEAPVVVDGVLHGTVNFARVALDQPFDEDDLLAAGLLVEHLRAAIRRAQRAEEVLADDLALRYALDRTKLDLVVTSTAGRIIHSSSGAAAALGVNKRGDTALETALARVVAQMAQEKKRVLRVRLGQGRTICGVRLPQNRGFLFLIDGDRPTKPPDWSILTPREREIVALVGEGLTTREIAARTFVSENTVKQHLKRIFAKSGARNRADLVHRAWSVQYDEEG